MYKVPKSKNRSYARKWYAQQKNPTGVVYLVTNILTGDQYVGATTNSIKKRWWQHVAAANQGKDTLAIYSAIREYGKEVFEVVELYRCLEGESIKESEKRFIQELNPSLNKNLKKDGN